MQRSQQVQLVQPTELSMAKVCCKSTDRHGIADLKCQQLKPVEHLPWIASWQKVEQGSRNLLMMRADLLHCYWL